MRDGVQLATDVYLPETEGPVPVVLTRLPYDKNGEIIRIDVFAEALLERGYALVAQDTRGKFRSEGETVPWVNEALDGYDTIDWIVKQPWSNGRVGMTGLSYVGFTQWAALSTNHPALRAIAPRNTNTNLGAAQLTPGEPEWAFYFQYVMDFYVVNDLLAHDEPFDWSHRPLINTFEDAVERMGVRPPAMDMHLSAQPPLRRFPEGHPLDAKPVPVLLSLGWFDPYCRGEAMRDYHTMMANPAWHPLVHLRLGPHDHDDTRLDDRPDNVEHEGSIDIPLNTPEQLRSWFEGELRFFDRYLKADEGTEPLPPVEYQLAHSDEVRHATAWPPPESTRLTLHLADGRDDGNGRLVPQRPGDRSSASWTHDPDKLVPTATHLWSLLVAEWPDYRGTADREDVLAFRCDPQTQPLELAGPVTLHATVSTTGPAMDVFAFLLDLEPDGSARFICRGQRRLSAPEPTDLTMSVGEAGYVVRPGHSLLLMVCGSDYPDFIPLTGTQERWWYATSMRSTVQTLDIGGDAGARLELTVL